MAPSQDQPKTGTFELHKRYGQRKKDRTVRTDEEICKGNYREIAYDSLLQLYSRYDIKEIVAMIEGNPTVNSTQLGRNLDQRFSTAIWHRAEELDKSITEMQADFEKPRQQRGLVPLRDSLYTDYAKRHTNPKKPHGQTTAEECDKNADKILEKKWLGGQIHNATPEQRRRWAPRSPINPEDDSAEPSTAISNNRPLFSETLELVGGNRSSSPEAPPKPEQQADRSDSAVSSHWARSQGGIDPRYWSPEDLRFGT